MSTKSDPLTPVHYALLFFFVAAFWIVLGFVIHTVIK
jgi:hypothetical protein